jgi:hypothetical protein
MLLFTTENKLFSVAQQSLTHCGKHCRLGFLWVLSNFCAFCQFKVVHKLIVKVISNFGKKPLFARICDSAIFHGGSKLHLMKL